MAKAAWQSEIEEAVGHVHRALRGPFALVEVTPVVDPVVAAAGGYAISANPLGVLDDRAVRFRVPS